MTATLAAPLKMAPPLTNAVRAGLRRGVIELRQMLTTPSDLIPTIVMIAAFISVMLWTKGTHVPGTTFSLGTTMLASVLGMNVAFNSIAVMGGLLAAEHEDGTLLRAKATPNGMLGYLVGKVVTVSGTMLLSVVSTLITGVFLFSSLAIGSAATWLTLAWVLILGVVATLPLGAISGIFYPITHLPQWLQYVGQVFPMYWLGLGMRSALLPHQLAAVEIGHSWRHLLTFLVLAGWAAVGLAVAPMLLRRMARRESGSAVSARLERAMRRTP